MSYLPADLRDRLLEADNRHCVYCHTREANTGQPMTVDHIIPQGPGEGLGFTGFNPTYTLRALKSLRGGISAP